MVLGFGCAFVVSESVQDASALSVWGAWAGADGALVGAFAAEWAGGFFGWSFECLRFRWWLWWGWSVFDEPGSGFVQFGFSVGGGPEAAKADANEAWW